MFQSQTEEIFTMRSNSKGTILTACQMSFSGMRNAEIAQHFDVSDSTVSRWRKKPLWIEFEQELLAAEKKAVLNAQLKTAEAESPAQG